MIKINLALIVDDKSIKRVVKCFFFVVFVSNYKNPFKSSLKSKVLPS